MNNDSIRKSFRFSIPSLHGEARRLLEALQDPAVATPVTARLSPTLVADFAAQVALVAQHGTEQSGAFGTVHALTHTKAGSALAYRQLAGFARRCAGSALSGQGPLLRSEFSVGIRGPRDLPSVLDRARKLLAACQTYSPELAPHGWTAADTTALAAAIDALGAARQASANAADAKQGVTARLNAGANALYTVCRKVQNAADFVYPAAKVPGDPTIVESRARFLLGEFPRRLRSGAKSPAAAAATPGAAPVGFTPATVVPVTVPAAA